MNKYLHIQKEPKFLSHVIHYIGTVTSRFCFFLWRWHLGISVGATCLIEHLRKTHLKQTLKNLRTPKTTGFLRFVKWLQNWLLVIK